LAFKNPNEPIFLQFSNLVSNNKYLLLMFWTDSLEKYLRLLQAGYLGCIINWWMNKLRDFSFTNNVGHILSQLSMNVSEREFPSHECSSSTSPLLIVDNVCLSDEWSLDDEIVEPFKKA
jgi:hypothetical protein